MIDQPVAIVTGAGSGIGRAVTLSLAGEGWCVALVGRSEARLRETADALGDAARDAPPALVVPGDVADPEFAPALLSAVVEVTRRVDALVNNAGFAPVVPIADTDDDVLRRTFEVNALGTARLIRAAWPHLVAAPSGSVVNVSSMGAADPFPGFFAYAAAKAAVESMARSVATEGRKHGVRGYAVAPGAVETAMLRGAFPNFPAERTLAPETVAKIIVDCVLDRGAPASGSTIPVPSP